MINFISYSYDKLENVLFAEILYWCMYCVVWNFSTDSDNDCETFRYLPLHYLYVIMWVKSECIYTFILNLFLFFQKLLTGLDYSKSKYESIIEQEKSLSNGIPPLSPKERICTSGKAQIPVNKQEVVKVEPPRIAQNLRRMYETGDLPDRHKIKKMEIDTKDAPDSGNLNFHFSSANWIL